ncbi:MAG: methylmalonyl-CoA mutase subunit beta [Tenacibaculum sp.]
MKFLFDEFNEVTHHAWKSKIQTDLKGDDYSSLLWTSNEGLTVKPFYTKKDRTKLAINLPKEGFAICQTVNIKSEKEANYFALDSLNRGAQSLEFIADKPFDYKILLKNISAKSQTLYFSFSFLCSTFTAKLADHLKTCNFYFNIDLIGKLASTGRWCKSQELDYAEIKKLIKKSGNFLAVNACLYQNAGANTVQQLAYALAHANEYLNDFGGSISKRMYFKFSVGSNYFFEIAKLRAFRILWSCLLTEYAIDNSVAHIFVQPSFRNKTLYDYNVNLLRTSSECLSAILGGANTVSNISYDKLFNESNEFGQRISRNQLLILQLESQLGEAQSIANGTYYIEALTEQLACQSLEVFKQIEKAGGFVEQLKKGVIQRKIKESANKEQQQFNKGICVLLGTNKIINQSDKMKDAIKVSLPKQATYKTLIEPILPKRLAEKLEQQRLRDE